MIEPVGFREMRERYTDDPAFAQCVNVMRSMMNSGLITSLDLRNAATLASVIWESENVQPIFLRIDR